MSLVPYKPAAPSAALMAIGLVTGKYQYQDDELHKRCSGCGEYWPADTEFFFAAKEGDRLNNKCRACYTERRWPNGRKDQQCHQ